MAPKKQMMTEAALVDLNDDELKEFLGYQYQALNRLERGKKDDPELQRLLMVAKDYENDNYNEEIKETKAKIKAARVLCEARGIRYKLPDLG